MDKSNMAPIYIEHDLGTKYARYMSKKDLAMSNSQSTRNAWPTQGQHNHPCLPHGQRKVVSLLITISYFIRNYFKNSLLSLISI